MGAVAVVDSTPEVGTRTDPDLVASAGTGTEAAAADTQGTPKLH